MTTTTWAHGVSGDFNTASNWTHGVPGAGGTALITAGGTYTVASSKFVSIGTLKMAKNATLAIDGSTFTLTSGTGTGALAGTIMVNSSGTNSGVLELGATANSTTFKNTGTIQLAYPSNDLVIAGIVTLIGNGNVILTNSGTIGTGGFNGTLINGSTSSGQTISGTGWIGDGSLKFVNAAKGIIDASGEPEPFANQALDILTASFTNSGLMEATGTGILFIDSNIDQSASGRIKTSASTTNSSGAAIVLNNASIVNGTVSIAGGTSLFSEGDTDLINTSANPITNAGLIATQGRNTLILSSVKNTGTGELMANTGGMLEITGSVTGGTAVIESGAEIFFQGPASADVTLVPGTFESRLVLEDPAQFTGSVAGLTGINTEIDLETIPFADGPAVSFNPTRHLLTVTDPVTHVTDTIKVVGTGSFTASMALDGSTLITDPPSDSASVPHAAINLLVQQVASFGLSNGVAGSGTGNITEHQEPLNFLATSSHHG